MPARVRVLGGVVEQVRQRLHEPHAVALDLEWLGRHVDGDGVPAVLDQPVHALERARDHVVQTYALAVEPDHAPRDARDVEQVLDETGELIGLPPCDVERGAASGDVEPRHGDGVSDRGERVPELVAQHGEKFVLRVVRGVDDRARVPLGIAPCRQLDAEGDPRAREP